MEDFAFPWDHPPPKPKSAAAKAGPTAAKARRSSILKGSSGPSTTKAASGASSSSERNALQDINNVNNLEKEGAAVSKKRARRSRVSFSATKIVKEFEVGSVGTVWNTTYEEEHGQSTLQSTSSASGSSESADENKPADVPDGGSRKRRFLQPETSDEVSPSKQTPLRLEIPTRSGAADGEDSGNACLPWGEKGGEDLMLESPLVTKPSNTFLSSLAPFSSEMCKVNTVINRGSPSPRRMRLASANCDLDKSTFHFDDANDSELEASTLCGANKTTRSDLDMDETRAIGPTLCSQSKRIASGTDRTMLFNKTGTDLLDMTCDSQSKRIAPGADRTMLFNKTGSDLLDMTSCVQNEEVRDASEMEESSGELSLTTAVTPSGFLNSLGTATTTGSVSSMEVTLIDRDGTDKRPHEVSMDMTRVVRPYLTSERANDKTMLALDEGMEMTVAIPSKKLAQNKTAADAPSDSDFLSMESTRIHRDETDKRPHEDLMEITRVIRPDLMSESANDKTMLALDEGMEMTVAFPSKKLAQNKTEGDASSNNESTSQELEITRATLFSRHTITSDVTTDVIETLIASDNGTELTKPASDETIAGLDEGMEMTVVIPPVVDKVILPEQIHCLMEKPQSIAHARESETLKSKSAQLEENSADEDDDDEVTFNAASMLGNPPSGISSDNVHSQEGERTAAERESSNSSSSSNDEDEDDGVFKEPMEMTKGISKDFREKLAAERRKSNSSSSGSPDDNSILPASFLEGGETDNDSVFLHSAEKQIHGTGKTNPTSSPPSRIAPGSIEEFLNPTSVDFSSVLGQKFEDMLSGGNDKMANWENCPMMKSVEKRMEKFESMIENRMRKAVEDAKKDCSEQNDEAGCQNEPLKSPMKPVAEEPKPSNPEKKPTPVIPAYVDIHTREMEARDNIFRALPWSLLKTDPWEISIGFMKGSIALNIRFGHILPVVEDRVKHWTVELIELQSRVLCGEVKIEELPCGWTKDNVRLSHKILLRKLTPAALEKMCPTTQSLAETIGVIVEEAAGAEMFTLDLHMPSWHFTNSDNKVTVGFVSERLVMSYLVDLDFSSRDFETTRKSGLSLRKNSGRAENIPGEEEIRKLARTMDSVGWNFFGEFMAKVDAFNKERESKFSDAQTGF